MKLIAHRGNRFGRSDKENHPEYILEAINEGYYVEIDVWIKDGLFLGHDKPEYPISQEFLLDIKDHVYAHAKNIKALAYLLENGITCFSHDRDDAVLTSNGEIWTFPGRELTPKSICVMPEWYMGVYEIGNIRDVVGICSDYVGKYE
jgi:hypothetical protein